MRSISFRSYVHFSRKYHLLTLAGLMSLVFLISAGCQPLRNPITYVDLCGITREQIGKMEDEAVRNWIAQKYGSYHTLNLDAVLAEAGQEKGSVTGYGWGAENDFHGEVYLRSGHLIRISLNNIKSGLTIGHVVDNIGPPDWVLLVANLRDPVLYYFQLDYPQMGFSVGIEDLKSVAQLGHDLSSGIKLERRMSIDWIECYSPDQMETVLENDFFLSEANTSVLMQARTTWSGFETYIPLTK
jgi:hypothetical protein